jgi:hypothetical protein
VQKLEGKNFKNFRYFPELVPIFAVFTLSRFPISNFGIYPTRVFFRFFFILGLSNFVFSGFERCQQQDQTINERVGSALLSTHPKGRRKRVD